MFITPFSKVFYKKTNRTFYFKSILKNLLKRPKASYKIIVTPLHKKHDCLVL